MGRYFGLTDVECELVACARQGKELDLSRRSDSAARTIRAQVIIDLATLPFARWRIGPFRPKALRLKAGVIVGGALAFRGKKLTRPVVLTECHIEEPIRAYLRQTA